jgi:2-polyprenyl-3-methyl-5-hydroxy-6-metoxy-1,4-benzoquinol methylase
MKDNQQAPQNQWNSGDSDTTLVEASEQLPLTWERFIPKQIADDSVSRRFLQLHYDRYQTAAPYVSEKQVLDIACGAGYGSQMLSQAGAKSIIGVDVCDQTIDYAQKNYQSPGVTFICANAEEFTWPESFDVVISFETIEHLHQPAQFLDRLHSLLVPGGSLLLSVPLGETSHFDPYHLHAFSQDEVLSLLENAGFEVESYRCDPCFMNRSELLRWGRLYPASSPSVYEILFTPRGWRIMQDFVLRGGFNIPQLLVIARRK